MSPTSPFADRAPPKFIRGKLYKYYFETDQPTNWWRREYQVRLSLSLLTSENVQTCLLLQGEYLPALAADNEQLLTFLTHQGYIGEVEEHQPSTLAAVLAAIRALTRTVPPHVQIWSYAWLCLPPILSLLIKAASSN